MSSKTLMTVEDFALMTNSDIEDFELVEGELIPLSSGNPLHAKIRQNVEFDIRSYFRQQPIGVILGEIDCQLTHDTVRRPDAAIFFNERLQAIDRKKIPVPFAPDIAIEVLSPSESAVDVHRKALEYLAAGSTEVWQLDYDNGEIFVQTNTGISLLRGEQALESSLLPGFSVTVNVLLQGF